MGSETCRWPGAAESACVCGGVPALKTGVSCGGVPVVPVVAEGGGEHAESSGVGRAGGNGRPA